MTMIGEAKRVFDIEAQSILDLKEKLNEGFDQAADLLLRCTGKVVVTGMGKSARLGGRLLPLYRLQVLPQFIFILPKRPTAI